MILDKNDKSEISYSFRTPLIRPLSATKNKKQLTPLYISHPILNSLPPIDAVLRQKDITL